MRTISRFFLLSVALLLLPQVARAHDFKQNNGLFFNSNTGVYRQKNDSRPWQLVSLPEQSKIKQSVSFDGKIWLVIEVGAEQYLYRQTNLLNFGEVISIPPAGEIVLKQTKNNLVAFRRIGTEIGLIVFRKGSLTESIIPPLVSSKDDLARIVELDGNLLYLQQTSSTVEVFRQRGSVWQSATQFVCESSRLIEEPIVGLYCGDGTVRRPETVDRWAILGMAPIRDIYSSKEILAGWDKADDNLFHVWASNRPINTTLLTPTAAETDQIAVIGDRILLRKTGGNWFELLWQAPTPIIAEISGSAGGIIIQSGTDEQLLINSVPPLLSIATSNWQTLTVAGQFSVARQTPLGLLIWNAGSLTQ